ncbi:endonuclease/exonuclease/phosphatase family protein [Roseovarius aestuariivivens]|uniref:endonuclease/exonuclease/phosphatase family protein n=1 Tax=Roseovarius aestuariivivens TaxID=1888910 RepID=UPI0010800629|nr:endonuclease/exonuclease/phosphatase family protein [Roseovarius aestuariivivens]
MKAPAVRIATYNLQKCVGLDMRRRPGRTLDVIAATGADLVVLQEADKRLAPRPAALPHDMAEAEGWRILPFGAPGGSIGWHGNAMLARPGLNIIRTAHLDLPGLEPRGAILAELDTPVGPLRVVGLHLGLVRRYRRLQLSTITRYLDRAPTMPTVLAGDFNEWRRSSWLERAAPGLRFLPTPPSFPAPRPVARLDRIAHCDRLQVQAFDHHAENPAQIASDHLPVWAEFTPAA